MREVSGGFTADSLHAQLTDFIVETAGSRIRQNLLLRYSSLPALKGLSSDVGVNATLEDSHIAISDLLLLQPSLPLKNKAGATIRLSSQVSGLIGDLKLTDCRITTGDSTHIDLTGSIRGLPEASTSYVDMNLREFSTSRTDIRALVADTVLPKNLVLPATVKMNGQFRGTMKRFFASAFIATSDGNVNGNATFYSERTLNGQSSRWNAEVSVIELNIGSLLNDPEMFGPVSFYASVAGTGVSKDDIQARMRVEVEKAMVNGYPYRHFSLNGTAGPQLFEGKAEMRDSNIVFTFDGTVNTSEENPVYKFRFDLKGADLQRLRLTTDDMRVSGVITSDLTGQTINDINGTVDVRHVVIMKNRRRYVIDSLLYTSVNKEKETHIGIESELLAATFDGTIALGDLPAAIEEHFARYFDLHDAAAVRASSPQAFTFQVVLRDPRIFADVFFPQFDQLTAGVIAGHYDSEKMDLSLTADIATAAFGGFDMDSITLKVTSDPQRLQATLRVGSAADSMLVLTNLQLGANVRHDSIAVALQSVGINGETKMLLAGTCTSVTNGYRWRFLPEGIVLQGTRWNVPSDNSLTFGAGHFIAHDLVMHGAGQSLSVKSEDGTRPHPPVTLTFTGFDLATLSRIVERDSGLVGGVLNGNVVLQSHGKQLAFTSDINVSDFAFARRAVGDIVVRANNRTENVYDVSMEITGNDNNIAATGQYRSTTGGSDLTLKCDLKKLNLACLEPLAFGAIRRLSGTASGELNVTGTFTKPSLTGNLAFHNTAFTPVMLGSYLRINDGRIMVDRKGVHFGSFEVVDTLGNTASLTGNVFTSDFREFRYDVRVSTRKFLLINTPASRDALYYGTVFLDSDISVEGEYAQPIIRMQARLDKGTDLAFVLPESEADVQHRFGIVRFLDVKNPSNPIMARRTSAPRRTRDTTGSRRSSIDLSADVEVNKESRLRILIDPIAGDSLVIRGEATFSVGVDRSGKLAVTGRYDIQDGSYQLSFGQFIRREFAIAKGSSLTWFGSVTEANVDITAIYTVKTSVLDLVQDQLVGLSQEEQNKYKQALRIQVYLTIDGKLLAPNIHFRLDLPPDQRGALGGSIYAKLNEINGQESELNKQVFALLVLGRFLSSNPLASAGDGGLSGFARSSVSQILTEQLNRLSEKVIPGVGLNLGVESYEDYSTGTAEGRTQLQVALTKELFDERVSVQVGGNADLEGQRSQQNALNNFAGDIKVGYKMTEDGRWVLQVFRLNTNGGAIEGDVVETGVGIVFAIDYDKLFGLGLTPVADKAEDK
ncbi:MAG: translocation/assembly module TamB domain-containing protein [Bacteroidota bacterium]